MGGGMGPPGGPMGPGMGPPGGPMGVGMGPLGGPMGGQMMGPPGSPMGLGAVGGPGGSIQQQPRSRIDPDLMPNPVSGERRQPQYCVQCTCARCMHVLSIELRVTPLPLHEP